MVQTTNQEKKENKKTSNKEPIVTLSSCTLTRIKLNGNASKTPIRYIIILIFFYCMFKLLMSFQKYEIGSLVFIGANQYTPMSK